jgi:hypothetical protein
MSLEQWRELDLALQDRVLGPNGGLHNALAGCSDLTRTLVQPLLDQTSSFLGDFLPTTDVAQVLLENAELPEEQMQHFLASSLPLVDTATSQLQPTGRRSSPEIVIPRWNREQPKPSLEQTFLLVPASESGKAYGEQARQGHSELQVVRAPGQAALMVCRERDWLALEPLSQLLGPCRQAYSELSLTPGTTPHSRGDISDWIPLDS